MLIASVSLVWLWQLMLAYYARLRLVRYILASCSVAAAAIYSHYLSPDHLLYRSAIETYGASGLGNLESELVFIEPFFLFIAKLNNYLDLPPFTVFLTFAAISVTLKIFLIAKQSRNVFLSFALYFSYFFLIHDSTQIRASLAIALLYYATTFLASDEKWKFGLIVILAAAFFHTSSLAFLPVLFLRRGATRYLWWVFGGAVCLYILKLSPSVIIEELVSTVGAGGVWGLTKIAEYSSTKGVDDVFDPAGLISVVTIVFALVVYRSRDRFNEFEVICFNCLLMSIIISFVFFDFGAIQTRLRAVYSFSMVFLVPFLLVKQLTKFAAYWGAILPLFGFFLYFAVGKGILAS